MNARIRGRDRRRNLLELQKRLTDYFRFWRTGEVNTWSVWRQDFWRAAEKPWEVHERAGRTAWPGHLPPHQNEFGNFQGMINVDRNPPHGAPYLPDYIDKDNKNAQKKRKAEKALEDLDRFCFNFDGIQFVKLIGCGTYGAVGLFFVTDRLGKSHRVVAKVDLEEPRRMQQMKDEKEHHKFLSRAKHIPQIVFLSRLMKDGCLLPQLQQSGELGGEKRKRTALNNFLAEQSRGDRKRARLGDIRFGQGLESASTVCGSDYSDDDLWDDEELTAAELPDEEVLMDLDHSPEFLLLEHLRGGDLHRWICKACEEGHRFSDKVLWRFFSCLMSAVLSMAYPPRYQVEPGEEPLNLFGAPLAERLEYPSVYRNFVHFDLDPRNVFVGDFDNDEHCTVPVLKAGDLGIMSEIHDVWKSNAELMWKSRQSGKAVYLTPEQFSEEWEWVVRTPGPDQRVAGKYSWKTNLYQVARIMFSLITLLRPAYPPVPEVAYIDPEDGPEWTYGGFLMNPRFSDVDHELRALVRRCMNEEPDRRPSLEEIRRIMLVKLGKDYWVSESDQMTRNWSEDFFFSPPPPPPPRAVAPVDPKRVIRLGEPWTAANREQQQMEGRIAIREADAAGNFVEDLTQVPLDRGHGPEIPPTHDARVAGQGWLASGPMDETW